MIMVKQNYIDQLINSKSKDLIVLKEVANAWTESSKETLLSWGNQFPNFGTHPGAQTNGFKTLKNQKRSLGT